MIEVEKKIYTQTYTFCAHVLALPSSTLVVIYLLIMYIICYIVWGMVWYDVWCSSFLLASVLCSDSCTILFIIFIGSKISIERIIIFVRLFYNLHAPHHTIHNVNRSLNIERERTFRTKEQTIYEANKETTIITTISTTAAATTTTKKHQRLAYKGERTPSHWCSIMFSIYRVHNILFLFFSSVFGVVVAIFYIICSLRDHCYRCC